VTSFNDMIQGYHRFREHGWDDEVERWEQLSKGQKPEVLLIACSDSRVDPATVLDTAPGEIFVVRNVANLVPPFEAGGGRHGVSAALEYAVTQLKVKEIVVMGHGSCGGVAAALSQGFKDAEPGQGGFVAKWIDLLDDAREKVVAQHGTEGAAVHQLELEGVRTSLENLKTFPFVQEALDKGELKLRGAWFGIAEGDLKVMDESGEFAKA